MITLAWQKARRFLRRASCTNNYTDWPEAFKPRELAALQYPFSLSDPDARENRDDLVERIHASVKAGSLASTARAVQAPMLTESQDAPPPPFPLNEQENDRGQGFGSPEWLNEFPVLPASGVYRRAGPGITRKGQAKPGEASAEAPAIDCRDFAIWLAAQREPPSENIKAWFDAKGVAVSTQAKGPQAIKAAPAAQSAPIELDAVTELQKHCTDALTKPRGVKREILEHWDSIALLHGTHPDVTQVARYLSSKRDPADKKPKRKTISNALSELRKCELIP